MSSQSKKTPSADSFEIPVGGDDTSSTTPSRESPESSQPMFKRPCIPPTTTKASSTRGKVGGSSKKSSKNKSKENQKSNKTNQRKKILSSQEAESNIMKIGFCSKPHSKCAKCGLKCKDDGLEFCRIDYIHPKHILLNNEEEQVAVRLCCCENPNCKGCFPICKTCGSQKCGPNMCLHNSDSMYRIDYV